MIGKQKRVEVNPHSSALFSNFRINPPHPLAGKYVFISDNVRRVMIGEPPLLKGEQ